MPDSARTTTDASGGSIPPSRALLNFRFPMKSLFQSRPRFLLPLILGAMALVGSVAITWIRLVPELADVRRAKTLELSFQVYVLRNSLSDLLARDQTDLAERRIADASTNPQLTALAVIGGEGKVKFSNRITWIHREASLIEGFQPSLAAQAMATPTEELLPKGDTLLVGYFPLELEPIPGTLRGRDRGVLFVSYDLSSDLAASRHQVLIKAGWFFGYQLILALVLAALLDKLVSRKKVEAFQAASEAKFSLLLEAAAVPMGVTHVSGRIEHINRQFTQTFGYLIEDIPDLDTWWVKAYPDADYREQVIRSWVEATQKAIHTGSSIRPGIEFRVTGKDGSVCIMELTGALVGDQMIVAFHDLTARVRAEAKLRDALEFNQALVAAQPMGLLAYHATSGQCVMASPGISNAIGATVEQALAQNFRQLDSWVKSGLRDAAEEAIATDEPQYLETHLKSTFGKQFWLAAHFATFTGGGEKHLLLLASDITERILANQLSLESERRLHTLLTSVDQIAVMLDLEGRVTFCNDFLLRVTGWTREEAMGQEWFQRFIPDDWEGVRRFFLDSIQRGQIDLHYENPILTRDGEVRLIQWTNTLLYDAEGVVAGTASLGKDITELRKSEEAVRASEQKFSRIFQSSPDAIIITDHDTGRVFDINPGFTRLLGYQPEEAIGHFTKPEDLALWVDPAVRGNIRQLVVEQGQAINFPAELRCKDGHAISVLVSSTLLNLAGISRTLSLVRDITEFRRTEEERRLLELQIQKAQKLESLGSLAGGMAHDMNNVLGAILGIASIHQETSPPDSPLQRAMDIIIKACLRGRTLVQGLLSFARKGLVEQQVLDLNSLVKDGVALLEHTTFRRIQLEIDLAEDLRPIQGDPSALSHVIMNLCVNAVDAMESGGTLRLATWNEPPDALVLEVADNGCGMSKEVLERAFDPFFTTKAQGKGTGLGLPIVYNTIKAHGGTLDVESTPGAGTTIRIHLPACDPVREEALPKPIAKAFHRSLHVLVVDDDDLVRSSLELMVKTSHHQSVGVGSGEEALQKLQEGLAVDVVILDMNMPGLGGETTLSRLRQLRPGLPVLLATGRVDQRVLDLVDQNAGVSLLSKPFTLEEVRRRIEDLTQD